MKKNKFFRVFLVVVYCVLLITSPALSLTSYAQTPTEIKSTLRQEVKPIQTVNIYNDYISGTTTICGTQLMTGGYGCITNTSPPYGVGIGTTIDNRFIGFPTVNKTSTVRFNLSALPAGQTVISASLSSGSCATVAGWGSTIGCGGSTLGNNIQSALQGWKAANYFPSFALSSSGALFNMGSAVLTITYGNREVDIKANGEDGPISVKAGSTVNLSWSSTGFSECRYGTIPAWYTREWPIGSRTPGTTGSTTTKIYFENVTYRIECKESGSGAVNADQVTVNVTP